MKNKIILSLLLVCALAMPVFAKAVSIDELKVLIASLQAQINALVAQLAQQQGGTTSWCHTFNTNLGMGSTGAEVNALHSILSKEVITGDFGWSGDSFNEDTASYVVALQEKYKSEILTPSGLIHGTGYVGKSTRAKLNKLYGCGTGIIKSITVSSPVANQVIKSPVLISGKAVAFEGQFNIRIKDSNGVVLLNTNTMGASSYGDPIPFSGQFVYNTPTAKSGTVEVFDISAKDGSETNKVVVPVSFSEYAEKTVKVITPNGGETLISGNSGYVTIKWESTGIDKVDVRLIDYTYTTSVSKPIVENLPASYGAYYWPAAGVASILDSNFKVGHNFRIIVTEKKADGTFGTQDQSDGFIYIDIKP